MKKKKTKLRTYYVQLVNHTDHADNEAIRVKATSPEHARHVVSCDFHRFGIGYIVWAGSKKKWDRWMLKGLKAICTNR